MDFPHSAAGTVHLLSKKSRRLHRDTFFFLPHLTGRLLGGLNQRLTPVTNATLHRWVHMMDPDAVDFELKPVTIKKTVAILSYEKEPAGAKIPADSIAPLAPGDYAWCVIDPYKCVIPPFMTFSDEPTFAELKSGAEQPGPREHLAEFLPWYHIPSSLENFVTTRDHGRCLITGSCSDDAEISVSWIFPPAWARWVRDLKYEENHSAISIPSNAMLMRKDLIAAFHDNAFGIDVDDDHRIVIFRDFGPALPLLTGPNSQAYFRRPGSQFQLPGPDDSFLREHFCHCLRVHLLHGDITDDYSPNTVWTALEDLGLWERGDEPAPLEDPRWNTDLGREILDCHLRMELERSGFHED